jgi:hypothetical protein
MEDNGFLKTAAKLHEAQTLLDEVRALLSEAADTVEVESATLGVTVTAV